ncbi:hypothetical protein LIER_18700 [Lithospermum erythrorhizon]|uniref:Uncharacterized protein n=1 Tax=Lithospermum erythrorhizon TaxID=34254 RepID=A0AAV3QF58_LITER
MSYARCLVDVDVSKPPVLEFGVKLSGGRRYIQKVTYECYPDYCCDCKTFGHNVFKCKKNSKDVEIPVVETPVVSPQVVPPMAPPVTPIPVVNPEPVISSRVTRSKARVQARNDSPPKESSPRDSVNVSTISSAAVGSAEIICSPSKNGKGLKGVGKDKAIISQIPVVLPNSFDALNAMGGSSGTHDVDIVDVQMGDLVPYSIGNATKDKEEGVWQHVTRKSHSNRRGGAISSSVSPCG